MNISSVLTGFLLLKAGITKNKFKQNELKFKQNEIQYRKQMVRKKVNNSEIIINLRKYESYTVRPFLSNASSALLYGKKDIFQF